jgi:small subunit ribosomal protein S3
MRRDRPPAPPVAAAPHVEAPAPEGPAVQATPGELPRRSGGPLMPPIAAPQPPSWKQESRPAAEPSDSPELPPPPAGEPEGSGS